MASTYTDAGIELIGVGEQANTWGQTTNTNWRLMEEMATGVVSISLNGTSSYDLTTTDGATSNGRHLVVQFTGSPGAAATVTVNPDDMQKVYFVDNSTDESITLTQGSGGDVTVPAGTKKIVYCDGEGSSAEVTDLTDNLSLSGTLDISTFKLNGSEVTATASELNTLDGINASTSELNVLDGITASTGELNTLNGLTASTAELNLLDGVTASTAELNKLDGVTSGIQGQLNDKADNNTTISAGGGLSGGGSLAANRTISHADTSSQASVNNSGNNNVIKSITVDTYGHITAIASANATPAGVVQMFAAAIAPDGWLECNGSAVSRSTYADLFSVIGTTFGNGNGSTTFNLPDLRGEFVRGWDNGRGADSGRNFGSSQDWAIENITGAFQPGEDVNAAYSGAFFRAASIQTGITSGDGGRRIGFDASRVVKTSNETRPRNIALMYIIKT